MKKITNNYVQLRTITFALIALMLSISQVNAQAAFGLKGGLNIANTDWKIADNSSLSTDSRLSAHAGLVLQLPLNEEGKSMMQFEALYSSIGNNFDDTYEDEGEEVVDSYTYRIGQLQVPILFRLMVNDGIFFNVGPYAAYNISAEEEYEDETEDIKKSFKDFDFGLAGGAGYALKNGLFIEARYNFGLSNNFELKDGDKSEWKNRVIQVGIGFIFNK